MARLSLNLPPLHIFRPCLIIRHPPQIVPNPLQHHKTRKVKTLACQTNPNLDESSPTEKSIAGLGNSKGTSSPKGVPPKFPSKDIKKKIAIVSFLGALGLLSSTRLHFFGVTSKDHCAHPLPSQEARPKGKPTVVELYAGWCEVCGEGELAPDVYKVEHQYKQEKD
ncbi:Thioredoxin protein HCF164 [Spatholobus suberectus]|nr:Thioredoxin protein HCF164 [Spatholobus suberectus]